MLVELRIEQLLLIERAEIEFSPGLNVFTGETGAGKSLLVDALEFLLGARGDAGMVRQGAAQAEVSGRFLLSDPELVEAFTQELGVAFDAPGKGEAELVLSRTLPRAGRARAYANGRPIALPALLELGGRLLDIHGQHDNESLLRPQTRLEILDRFAAAGAERSAARAAFGEALDAARALSELRRAARERQQREEMMRFQLRELGDARLDGLQPEQLEGEVRLLRGAERIRGAALALQTTLDGDEGESAAALLSRALRTLAPLGDAGPEAAALRERVENLLGETRDAAREAAELAERARSDPERLADLEERRERLRALERKYGRDLAALGALRDKLAADLSDFEHLDVRTEERETALRKAVAALQSGVEKLSRKRRAAARELEKRVNKELADLGLKDAKLQVVLAPHGADSHTASAPAESSDDEARRMLPANLRATGAESAEIVFSANPELPPRPLKDCASGGEISRVMLALKGVLARVHGADRLPVVVFDEIDSGVGGRLGAMLGRKLCELARVRQVLCVTHQPQIAAFGQRQLKVDKQRSSQGAAIQVECLDGSQRVQELAFMLRGAAASAHTRKEAEAMLKDAQAGGK